jgi:eukaryotic-like serine/threonine-protein kinase
MAKDPDERWQNAHDLAAELKWIAAGTSEIGMPAAAADRRRPRERGWMAAVALMALALIVLGVAYIRRQPAPGVPMRLSLARPAAAPYEYFDSAALSPDGRHVAFVGYTPDAKSLLWLRPLDSVVARPLAGTDGAALPFWSPDSRSLGFFAEGRLKRIDAAGGPPQVLCAAPTPWGGAWSREGVIVFASGETALSRVPASGGSPAPATRLLPREEAHRFPAFLPDGRHFLFLGDAAKTEDHFLRIGTLGSEESQDLVAAVSNAAYAPPGHLLFVRGRSLLAQPFDEKALRLTGEPAALAEPLVENASNHRFEFSVSDTGLLTYRSANLDRQLTWLDRSGRRLATVGDPGRTAYVELSPDQRRVAFVTLDQDGREGDIWLRDLARGQTLRLTFDPASDSSPVWSPDGSEIAFRSMRSGLGDLYRKSATSPGPEEALFKTAETASPVSWSPDGRFLLFEVYAASGANVDIWLLPLPAPAKPEPFLKTSFDEVSPQFSRDGRWVAYASNESGRSEVYVRAFPASPMKWQVSTSGGWRPRWRRDGRELFYLAAGGRMMAVSVQATAGRFEAADPRELFRVQTGDYDVAADAQRFLVAAEMEDLTASPLTVVLNWTAALKR